MTLDDVKARLAAGHDVCNVGQLDRRTVAWLRRGTKAGSIRAETDHSFPNPRLRYVATSKQQPTEH